MRRSFQNLLSIVIYLLPTCLGYPWLLGCYYGNDFKSAPSVPTDAAARGQCLKRCQNIGTKYAVIQSDGNCKCVGIQDELGFSLHELNEDCHQWTDEVRCHGDHITDETANGWTVYLLHGPRLNDVSLVNPQPIYAGDSLTVRVDVTIAKSDEEGGEWLNGTSPKLAVMWILGDRCVHWETSKVAYAAGLATFVLVQRFYDHGTYDIGVFVSTGGGVATTRRKLTVLPPIPSGLQLTLDPKVTDTPTCIPSHLSSNHVTVYSRRGVRFVAALDVGLNLTYIWSVDDQVVDTAVCLPDCVGLQCKKNTLVYSFLTEGVHKVSVNATNIYGWNHQFIYVMAVDYRLMDAILIINGGHRKTTNHVLTFVVSFITTHHVDTRILLEMGDGTQLNYSLQVDYLNKDITVRHDHRCILSAETTYSYNQEGEYTPNAVIGDGITEITTHLLRPIKVCHPINTGFISGDQVVSSRSPVDLSLHLNIATTCRLRNKWKLFNKDNSSLIKRSHGLTWRLRIRDPGVYKVEATTENAVSSSTFDHVISVQNPVRGLTLTVNGSNDIYNTKTPYQLEALYSSGSDVTCHWSLRQISQWHQTVSTDSCRIVLTFYSSETGSLNVTASNLVSSEQVVVNVTTVDPIHGVYLSSSSPIESRDPLVITMIVLKGSHLNVTVDNSTVKKITTKLCRIEKPNAIPGINPLTVQVNNPISEVLITTQVEVIPSLIGSVTILLQNWSKRSASFQAKFHEPNPFQQLLYTWKLINQDTVIYTSVPFVKFDNIIGYPENISLFLNVSNEVSSITAYSLVQMERMLDTPHLDHSFVTVPDQELEFCLKNIPSTIYNHVTITYVIHGLTALVSRTYVKEVLFPSSVERWTHVFDQPGTVSIKVILSSEDSKIENITLTSKLSVQLPLKEIRINGPNIVPCLVMLPLFYEWDIAISSEFNIGVVYAWEVDGKWKITTKSKITEFFNNPGSHVFNIKAWNGINKIATSFIVESVLIITEVNVTASPVLIGSPSVVHIRYAGSKDANVSISYGDGLPESIDVSKFQHCTESDTFEITVQHQYGKRGCYTVSVNISNEVSWMNDRHLVEVGEPITGVTLTLLTPSPIALIDVGLVIVQATVATGNDLVFHWDFDDNAGEQYTFVESKEKSSIARHNYGIAKSYDISVNVSNRYHNVRVYLNSPVQVVEPIRQVRLSTIGNVRAVPLLPNSISGSSNLTISTPVVYFEAQVFWGSDVEFLFDFGDGNQTLVPAQRDMLIPGPIGKCAHVYTKENAYTVKVTATNPLGSVHATLKDLFYVQIPPRGLELDGKYYVDGVGKPIVLQSTIVTGTNVSYDWYVGNNDHYSNAGPEITLRFHNTGKYNVTVQAYNKVTELASNISHLYASADVYIEETLQSAAICVQQKETKACEGDNVEILSDEEMVLLCDVLPTSETALRFIWNLGVGELKKTINNSTHHYYHEPGIFIVSVIAQNHISNSSSGKVVIHVVQKVSNLTSIRHQPSILVNETTTFHALYWFGTNLTFEWDFGDGSRLMITNSDKVQHTYSSVGEYWLNVCAYNKFSKASLNTNIFVLQQHCQKPEVKFVDQSLEKKVHYSEDIMIEIDTTISCELTNNISYLWKIFNNTNDYQNEISLLPTDILRQRQLIIPKETLSVGKYQIELKVQMKNTMVYVIEKTEITIIPSKITAFWEGGIWRTVGQKDNISMNIVSNIDPFESDFRFRWYCSYFAYSNQPCFKTGTSNGTIDDSSSNLNFSVQTLNSVLPAVSFKLNIWYKNYFQTSVTQELEVIEKPHTLPILIKRLHHLSHVIQHDCKVVFLAVCVGCKDIELEFEWKLWLVQDGNHNLHINKHNCVQADGSTFFIIADNTTTTTTTTKAENESELWTIEPPDPVNENEDTEFPPFPKLPGFPEDTVQQPLPKVVKKRETFQELVDNLTLQKISTISPFYDFPPVEGDDVYNIPNSRVSEGFPLSDLTSDSFDPFVPQMEDYGHVTIEGHPGESGSAAARDQIKEIKIQHIDAINDKTEEEILEETGKGRERGPGDDSEDFDDSYDNIDKVKDSRYPSTAPHLVRRPRVDLPLRPNLTSPEYLILEPRSLKIGSTYIVEVIARTKDKSDLEGKAMDFLTVNMGPMNGRCTLTPMEGEEFDTLFRLHCMEWRSDQLPLIYELYYSLTPNTFGHLVYSGLNGNTKFILPAGHPQYNYSVYIDVIVKDKSGSSTRVCSIVTEVFPKWDSISDMMVLVNNETTNIQSLFNKLLGERNLQAVLHQIHVWATSLNRIISMEITKRNKRSVSHNDLRAKLINVIDKLEIIHVTEAHQVISTLLALLEIPTEVSIKEIQNGFEVVQKLCNKTMLYGSFPVEIFQESVMKFASHIIHCVMVKFSTMKPSKALILKSLIKKCKIILMQVTEKKLSSLLPNEKPYILEMPHMDVFAGYISVDNPQSTIEFGKTELVINQQLHIDIFNISDIFSCRKTYPFNCDCIAITGESYTNNPYINEDSWSLSRILDAPPVSGVVSSVTFHTCETHETIDVIHPQVEFHLHRLEMDLNKEYILTKENIHIHQLNLTKDQVNRTIFFFVHTPYEENKDGIFPLQLLFSANEHPQPNKYIKKQVLKKNDKTAKLLISETFVREPGLYYFAIFDDQYSKHSQQNDDLLPVSYKLNIWLEQCLFWDKSLEHWSTEGCSVLETTGIDSMHCRCESLGPVGYKTLNLVTELQILPIDNFLGTTTHLLPIIIIFILYFVLLIYCHFQSAKDGQKTPLIILKDNSHKQGYLLIIRTGFFWDAGTTAMVCIVLHGENGMSETTPLSSRDFSHILFQRSSINTFYMSTQSNLGKIWKVQIWHNNSGISPSWFLKDITVLDMSTGNPYYFECEQWLSVEEEDGQIEKEIPLNEIPWNFKKLYQETFIQYLCDYHLWSSVYSKPPYSSYNRIQRLTCCFSLVMTSAALIAVWYKFQYFEHYMDYGLLDISWQTVLIGVITGSVVMLPHQILSSLFRNSDTPRAALLNYLQPLFYGWSWHILYCNYQQKEANASEETSGSVTSINSRSIYSADSLSQFDESLESTEDNSSIRYTNRDYFSLLESTNSDIFDAIENPYQHHSSWESYSEMESSIENDLCETYRRNFLSDYHLKSDSLKRNKNTRKQYDINQSDQTSSGFEDWTEKVTDSTSYDRHLNTVPIQLLNRLHHLILPSWVQFLAWILMLTVISLSTFISVTYVYTFGDHSFICWLQSLFYSILSSMFVLHPLWVSFLAIFSSLKVWLSKDQTMYIYSQVDVIPLDEITKVDYQLKTSPEYFEGETEKLIKRQHARYLRYLRPPPESTLIQARRRALKSRFILDATKGISASLIILILLMIMAFGKDTRHYFHQNISIQNAFLRTANHPATSITSQAAWWRWIKSDFLDAYYEEADILSNEIKMEPILSTGSIPMGRTIIRNYEVVSEACLELFEYFYSNACFPSYSTESSLPNEDNKTVNHPKRAFWGKFGYYNGDGHSFTLGKIRKEAYNQLHQLHETNWLDNQSRAVTVEFMLYNPTFSIFIPVMIVTEFAATGNCLTSALVMPCQLYQYVTKTDFVVLACHYIFLTWILWMFKKEIWKLWKVGKFSHISLWRYYWVAFYLLSISYISCHIYRTMLVTSAIQHHYQSHEFYLYVSRIAEWDQILKAQVGLLIFLHLISWIEFLHISSYTGQFLKVFSNAQKEIIAAIISVLLLLTVFSHVENLAFGSNEFTFTNPILQALQMVRLVMRQSTITRYSNIVSMQAQLYAISLLFGMLIILMITVALIKAVIIKSKHHIHPRKEVYVNVQEIVQLFQEKIMHSFGLSKKEDPQCREINSPPAELLLMELETLVDDVFAYANKLFSDVECVENTDLNCQPSNDESEEKDSPDSQQTVAELHFQETERLSTIVEPEVPVEVTPNKTIAKDENILPETS